MKVSNNLFLRKRDRETRLQSKEYLNNAGNILLTKMFVFIGTKLFEHFQCNESQSRVRWVLFWVNNKMSRQDKVEKIAHLNTLHFHTFIRSFKYKLFQKLSFIVRYWWNIFFLCWQYNLFTNILKRLLFRERIIHLIKYSYSSHQF